MPLGIDATIRFATGNYTEPLTESELAVDSPYNTRTNAGLPPGPINSPGLDAIEAAAHPAKADYLYYVNKPNTCNELAFSKTEAEFEADVATLQRGARSQRRQRADHLRGIAMPRLAVLGHPVAHSRSPAMQNAALAALGLGEEWSYEAIDVAPEEFEARVRAMAGRRLRRRQRHRPAQGGGAGARRQRQRDGAGDRRRQHAGLRRRRDRGPQHRRRRPARRAAGPAAGQPGAGPRRRRRRPGGVWALVREGAEVEVWNRTELARRARPLRASSAASAGRRARPGAPTS